MKTLLVILSLIALFAALTMWRAARHEARAVASFPPSGQLMEIDGVQVHARVMGDADNPDLVLIHGSNGNLRDLTFTLAPMLAERHRVILIDRPGLGYTHRLGEAGATITEQATLLQKTAAALGAEKPIVLGHSYGGAVALAWAVHHPEHIAGLVPVASPAFPWDAPLSLFYRVTSSWWGSTFVVPLITAWAPDSVVENALKGVFDPQAVPEGYADHFGPVLTLRRMTLRANARQRAGLKQEITVLHDMLGEIDVPVEIVHGTADTTVGLSIHAAPPWKSACPARISRAWRARDTCSSTWRPRPSRRRWTGPPRAPVCVPRPDAP